MDIIPDQKPSIKAKSSSEFGLCNFYRAGNRILAMYETGTIFKKAKLRIQNITLDKNGSGLCSIEILNHFLQQKTFATKWPIMLTGIYEIKS
jgi:hypothetical protein